jgi:hypothetical protein
MTFSDDRKVTVIALLISAAMLGLTIYCLVTGWGL